MRSRWLFWSLFYIGLLAGLAYLGYYVLYPTYRSPDSRLWSMTFGYPALLRALEAPIPVEVTPATRRHFRRTISATGMIEYSNELPVNVETPGIVTEVHVDIGDSVERGQVLLVVNAGQFQTRLSELEVRLGEVTLKKAEEDYQREKKAYERGVTSLSNFKEFERAYREAQIFLRKARVGFDKSRQSRSEQVVEKNGWHEDNSPPEAAKQINILAPISGIVTRLNTIVGENFVSYKNGALHLGDRLVFAVAMDERYYPLVQVGDEASIYINALPNKTLRGTISRISPVVSGPGRKSSSLQIPHTFQVLLDLTEEVQEGPKIASGMAGFAVIERTFDSIAIPDRSLLRFSGGKGLVLVADEHDQIQARAVTYSVSLDGWVAIQKGVRENERVVVVGQTGLKPGDRIEARLYKEGKYCGRGRQVNCRLGTTQLSKQ